MRLCHWSAFNLRCIFQPSQLGTGVLVGDLPCWTGCFHFFQSCFCGLTFIIYSFIFLCLFVLRPPEIWYTERHRGMWFIASIQRLHLDTFKFLSALNGSCLVFCWWCYGLRSFPWPTSTCVWQPKVYSETFICCQDARPTRWFSKQVRLLFQC